MPFANATFDKIAPVTPEQSAPMMPTTPSAVIKRSAAADAAAAVAAEPNYAKLMIRECRKYVKEMRKIKGRG